MNIVTSTSGTGALLFGNTTAATAGRYAGAITYSHTANSLTFDTDSTNRMVINSTGLGIGTSSPATKLNIENAGACQLQMAYSSSIFGRVGRLSSGNYEFSSYENGGNVLFGTTTTNGSTSERMRIDSAGNVGIGTTSPNYKLQLNNSASGASNYLQITHADAGTANTDGLQIGLATGSSPDAYIAQKENAPLIFQTNSAERARITSDGNLLVGKAAANLGVAGLQFIGGAGGSSITSDNTTTLALNRLTSDGEVLSFWRSTSQVGSVSVTTTATAYNTSSDYRLKNTIAPMTGALAKVALLKPCAYKWNADGSDGEGFIAHELAEVVPYAVTGEKDAVDADGKPIHQGIDVSFLVATLTAAIQELKAEFDAYKASHP